MLAHLAATFPDVNIGAKTVEDIDETTYRLLQSLVSRDITMRFNKGVIPVQYDDIMWNILNRSNIEV